MTDILEPLGDPISQLDGAMEGFKNELDACLAGAESGDLDLLLRTFFMLDWLVDQGKEFERMANVHLPHFKEKINKKMEESGLEKMQSHGHNITPEIEAYVSVPKDFKDQALAWLKAHPTGRELVREDYNAKSLQSFVKEELLANGKLPPAFVKTTLVPTIKIRKVPTKN